MIYDLGLEIMGIDISLLMKTNSLKALALWRIFLKNNFSKIKWAYWTNGSMANYYRLNSIAVLGEE